jgi:hypothetical protein
MTATTARQSSRCHRCGATITAWAPAERHAWAEHHVRIELITPCQQDRLASR